MEIRDGTGTQNLAKVDGKHRLHTTSVNLTNAHHEVHIGYMFEGFVSQITANADTNQTIISLKTGINKKIHMFAFANTSGQSWFYVYENPTIVAGGGTSAVSIFNKHRGSVNISTIIDSDGVKNQADFWDETDSAGANITLSDGTLIHQELLGADRTSFAQSRGSGERILKPNTNYAFLLENEGAAANIHNIVLEWYEKNED